MSSSSEEDGSEDEYEASQCESGNCLDFPSKDPNADAAVYNDAPTMPDEMSERDICHSSLERPHFFIDIPDDEAPLSDSLPLAYQEHLSTIFAPLSPQVSSLDNIGAPSEKRRRTTRHEGFETDVNSCMSNAGKEKSLEEKITIALSCDKSNYSSWDGYYKCFETDEENPRLLERNIYPSKDNPAVIPLMFNQCWRIISSLEPINFELSKKTHHAEQVPVILAGVITKFLSLVHLHTVVGLQSQAFAYSHSLEETIPYLAVFPQINNKDYVSDVNRTGCEKQFYIDLSRFDTSASRGTYTMRCWIITHPTTDVFLSEIELLKLFEYSCPSNHCFFIVISPRNMGIKMICFRLTSNGFKEISRLKREVKAQNPSNEMAQNAFLHSRMMESKTIFYRQIPCDFIDGECFIRDYRTYANVIKQVHVVISLGDYSMW